MRGMGSGSMLDGEWSLEMFGISRNESGHILHGLTNPVPCRNCGQSRCEAGGRNLLINTRPTDCRSWLRLTCAMLLHQYIGTSA